MGVATFIKNLIKTDSLFGTTKKKLTGIHDAGSVTAITSATFDSVTNSVTFSTIPTWISVGKFFRVTVGGGGNITNLFLVQSISGNTVTIDSTSISVANVADFVGPATVDGRMWMVIDNVTIAKQDPTSGNTIFNVNNYTDTGLTDGSKIANSFAAHYHTDQPTLSASKIIMSRPAGVNISAFTAVYLSTTETVLLGNSSDKTLTNAILGIALNTAPINTNVDIQTIGILTRNSWNWIPRKALFFDVNGNLTQTPPTVGFRLKVAKAITPTTIFINIETSSIIA